MGRRVRERRLDLDLSQEEVAHAATVHPTWLSGVERGQRNLSVLNLLKLARALGMDPCEVVEGLRP
jgi:transcriptional regulator with XRE-family HTH domain